METRTEVLDPGAQRGPQVAHAAIVPTVP
jgi:hypothetical protein